MSDKTPWDIITCTYCKTQYRRNNQARHRKSKLCQSYQKANDMIKNFVLNYKKGDSIDDKILTPYKNDKNDIIYLSAKQINLLKNIKDIQL